MQKMGILNETRPEIKQKVLILLTTCQLQPPFMKLIKKNKCLFRNGVRKSNFYELLFRMSGKIFHTQTLNILDQYIKIHL